MTAVNELRAKLEAMRLQAETNSENAKGDGERASWAAMERSIAELLATNAPEVRATMGRFEDMMDRVRRTYGDRLMVRLARSWTLADREGQRARLRTVTALVLELDRIRKVDGFGTRLGEGAIERVIEGDWEDARRYANDFRFLDEGEELRARYAPLWATFVETLEAEALVAEARERARPGEETPEN